jgi:hypothetical protein
LRACFVAFLLVCFMTYPFRVLIGPWARRKGRASVSGAPARS